MNRRLEPFHPDALDPGRRALYERILAGPRSSAPATFPLTDAERRLQGPLNAWLLNTELGAAFDVVGAAIRFGLTLPPRSREIAILAVAHHYHCEFELYAHEIIAAQAGLSAAEIATLSAGEDTPLASASERVVLAAARSLLRTGDLDDELYAESVAALGVEGVFELLALVGWYTLLALQLNAFRVPPPDAQGAG